MKTPWFHVKHFDVGPADVPTEEADHALRSRRMAPGDAFVLFDGVGRVGHGALAPATGGAQRKTPARRDPMHFMVERIEQIPPLAVRLTLFCGTCKGDRLSYLVEKCTELGAAEIFFPDFEHSIVDVGETHLAKLRRTAIEACKQCGLPWLPLIEKCGQIRGVVCDWLSANAGATLYIGDPDAESLSLAQCLESEQPRRVAVMIGPEGGLSPAEVADLASLGRLVRLATNLLRVETAASAAAATVADFETRCRRVGSEAAGSSAPQAG